MTKEKPEHMETKCSLGSIPSIVIYVFLPFVRTQRCSFAY